MLEWVRQRLNERHDRQVAYQGKVDTLTTLSQTYQVPEVLQRVQTDVMRSRPSRKSDRRPSWLQDDTLVTSNIRVAVVRQKKRDSEAEPLLRGRLTETTEWETFDRTEEHPHTHTSEANLYELELSPDGEFRGRLKAQGPIVLGTVQTIRNADELRLAVERHIARIEGRKSE